MMRHFKQLLGSLLLLVTIMMAGAQTPAEWEKLDLGRNVFMANDMGRNGYYKQRPMARLMGEMADVLGPECVIAAGDIHHFMGVESVNDPLWMTNFETIYDHPELMIPWYPVCGNHEYRGCTQAVLDYAHVSRRWMMPARYYSKVLGSGKKGTLRIVFLDTTPLINKYRNNPDTYPDACHQDRDAQLAWLDSTLRTAREDWVIVVGHHPVYAQTTKSDDERTDMQRYVQPVLRRYGNVAIYACGHIHNFQHIKVKGDDIDYVVNSSNSLSRKNVSPIQGTVWCNGGEGFSVISWNKHSLRFYMIDDQGHPIHTVAKDKRN